MLSPIQIICCLLLMLSSSPICLHGTAAMEAKQGQLLSAKKLADKNEQEIIKQQVPGAEYPNLIEDSVTESAERQALADDLAHHIFRDLLHSEAVELSSSLHKRGKMVGGFGRVPKHLLPSPPPPLLPPSPTYSEMGTLGSDYDGDGHSDSSGEMPWANSGTDNEWDEADGPPPSSSPFASLRHESPSKIVRYDSFPASNQPKLIRQGHSKIRRHLNRSKSAGSDDINEEDINWNKNPTKFLLESGRKPKLGELFANSSPRGGGGTHEIVSVPNSPDSTHSAYTEEAQFFSPMSSFDEKKVNEQNSPQAAKKSLKSKAKQLLASLGKKKPVKMAKKACNGLLTCFLGPAHFDRKQREKAGGKEEKDRERMSKM